MVVEVVEVEGELPVTVAVVLAVNKCVGRFGGLNLKWDTALARKLICYLFIQYTYQKFGVLSSMRRSISKGLRSRLMVGFPGSRFFDGEWCKVQKTWWNHEARRNEGLELHTGVETQYELHCRQG